MRKQMFNYFMMALMLTFTVPTMAQRGGGQGDRRPEVDYTKLATELSLSADQVASLKALDADSKAKFQALRESSRDDREAMRSQMQGLQEDRKAKMADILSAEQLEKWNAKKDEGRENAKEKVKERRKKKEK